MRRAFSGREGGVSIHGKTGAGPDEPANTSGAFSEWYVGYLRQEGMEPVVFALHARGPSFGAIAQFRRAFALQLLTDIGLLGATDPF